MTDITQTIQFEKLKDDEYRAQDHIKDIYFASAAHELRTPLNSILPLIDVVITYLTDPEAIRYA